LRKFDDDVNGASLYYVQCCDAVDSATGVASGLQKPDAADPKGDSLMTHAYTCSNSLKVGELNKRQK